MLNNKIKKFACLLSILASFYTTTLHAQTHADAANAAAEAEANIDEVKLENDADNSNPNNTAETQNSYVNIFWNSLNTITFGAANAVYNYFYPSKKTEQVMVIRQTKDGSIFVGPATSSSLKGRGVLANNSNSKKAISKNMKVSGNKSYSNQNTGQYLRSADIARFEKALSE